MYVYEHNDMCHHRYNFNVYILNTICACPHKDAGLHRYQHTPLAMVNLEQDATLGAFLQFGVYCKSLETKKDWLSIATCQKERVMS